MDAPHPLLSLPRRWLFPGRCLLCQAASGDPHWDLCRDCHADLPWLGDACQHCALPVPSGQSLCGDCQRRPPPFTATAALFRYQRPVDALIHRLKYRRQHSAGRLLGQLLAALASQCPAVDAVVPVPLHWRRQLGRGFNQAAVLAAPLARALDAPLRHRWLRRSHATPRQQGLNRRARRRLQPGTFVAASAVTGQRLLLVDDVFTTGATVHAASRALLRAGAAEVWVAVLARTP